EERLGEMILVVARCQPAIARRDACAEGMSRFVETSPLKIKSDRLGRGPTERSLSLDGIRPRRNRNVRLDSATANRIEQRYQFRPQRRERCRDRLAGCTGFVIVEQ